MQAYRHETVIQHDGTLLLRDLPLQAGEKVEVIIIVQSPPTLSQHPYPLRGTPLTYIDPTEPVASSDWEVSEWSNLLNSQDRFIGIQPIK